MSTIDYQGVQLHLSEPVELNMDWVGREDLLHQVLASWMVIDKDDIPLCPRLVGKPGVGKTTLAYSAARAIGKEVYLFQATMDTRPEDLVVTPVVSGPRELKYVASPVVTAMLRGGVLILDEGNRMSEKAWASLAPLLDRRKYVESLVAGTRIHAHEDFRFCTTMNQDSSTFDLPEYIHSRLQPQIYIDFPDATEEKLILRKNLPFSDEEVLDYVVRFLQSAHESDETYTVRDGVNIARFAMKVVRHKDELEKDVSGGPESASGVGSARLVSALKRSVLMILGGEALKYLPDQQWSVEG